MIELLPEFPIYLFYNKHVKYFGNAKERRLFYV